MSDDVEIRVPDIGDFQDVPVIEVLVAPGDAVEAEDPLITLESDKATMDVPAPEGGTVGELRLAVGDQVSEGTVILTLRGEAEAAADEADEVPEQHQPTYGSAAGVYETIEVRVPDLGVPGLPVAEVRVGVGQRVGQEEVLIVLRGDDGTVDVPSPAAGTVAELAVAEGETVAQGQLIVRLDASAANGRPTVPAAAPPPAPEAGPPDVTCDVVVLGSGPGGYSAAFRAADLGLRTVLVERYPTLGGVCLNVGCIPSKALLHTAKVITEAEESAGNGVAFGVPQVDLDALRAWKDGVVGRLTGGLDGLARQRSVRVVRGTGVFASPHALVVEGEEGSTTVGFEHAIVAVGSAAAKLPGFPEDPRIMDSTAALALQEVPGRLLVVGGGIIGLEMSTVYDALGSRVTVVELMDALIPGCDRDLVRPLQRRIEGRYEAILLKTRVTGVEAADDGLRVSFEGEGAPEPQTYDRILVAVGRRANGGLIRADLAGVEVDDRGFLHVDEQGRTNVPHVFAIGDVVGEPMLAHKAVHEGHVAAEVIAGRPSGWDGRVVPSVAYTNPEVAWVGLTETGAKAQGIDYEKGAFPWAASGRSLSLGRDDGTTKLLVDPDTRRVLGAGMVGPGADELVSEAALAIEMGADAEDVGLTIHPHPTLSETVGFAAEMVEGTITDLMPPRAKRARATA